MRPALPLLLTLALFAAPAAAAEPAVSPYALFAVQEARVAAIGFRLTTANVAWCHEVQPQFGWMFGDPRLYADQRRAEALAAYRAGPADAPYVAAIAPGSPADRAGVAVGMPLVAVNGIAVPAGDAKTPFSRISALEGLLAALPPSAPVRISGQAEASLVPVAGCVTDFRLEPSARRGAFSNGRIIRVNTALVDYAADDDELAAGIAHELAHNILRHTQRLNAAGIDRGLAKAFGRNRRLIRQTEVEADRLSVWLLAGAGYDPHAAVRFWTRFGQGAQPLLRDGTHPGWRDRVASIETEIAAIDAARAAGRPLEPPLIASPPPLE